MDVSTLYSTVKPPTPPEDDYDDYEEEDEGISPYVAFGVLPAVLCIGVTLTVVLYKKRKQIKKRFHMMMGDGDDDSLSSLESSMSGSSRGSMRSRSPMRSGASGFTGRSRGSSISSGMSSVRGRGRGRDRGRGRILFKSKS